MPDGLSDRAEDVWEPLIAIADQAGGPWPERARSAALVLSAKASIDDQSMTIRLLADLRDVVEELDADRLPDLVVLLAGNSTWPSRSGDNARAEGCGGELGVIWSE